MIGAELVAHFMGHNIDIEAITSGRPVTGAPPSLVKSVTYYTNVRKPTAAGSKGMANIVVTRSNP